MELRIKSLVGALPDDVQGALITDDLARRYYTGFPSSAGVLIIGREGSVFFTDFRYIEAARQRISGCEVVMLEDRQTQLPKAAAKLGIESMLIQNDYVSIAQGVALGEMFSQCKLIDDGRLSKLIADQRCIKSPDEIASIHRAQQISEQALQEILPSIVPGKSEREIALELEFATRRLGSEGASFDFIAVAGKNASSPHGVPSEHKVQQGELLTLDFGSIVDGYHGDMTRTFAVGQPDELSREIYEVVLEAQLAALNVIGEGVPCAEVDRAARDVITKAGYGDAFGHGTGHSVGLAVHESPSFSQKSQEVCRAGMVLSVEPGIYIPGKTGCRIEDLVLITQDGHKNLNAFAKEITIL